MANDNTLTPSEISRKPANEPNFELAQHLQESAKANPEQFRSIVQTAQKDNPQLEVKLDANGQVESIALNAATLYQENNPGLAKQLAASQLKTDIESGNQTAVKADEEKIGQTFAQSSDQTSIRDQAVATVTADSAALDKGLPKTSSIAAAEKAAGLTEDPTALREALAQHAFHDLANGSIKPQDLAKFPRVGGAFVATGAVTEEEMDKALARQKELGQNGAKAPRIGSVLQDMYKDNPVKLAKIQAASNFYDALQQQAKQSQATQPPAAPPK